MQTARDELKRILPPLRLQYTRHRQQQITDIETKAILPVDLQFGVEFIDCGQADERCEKSSESFLHDVHLAPVELRVDARLCADLERLEAGQLSGILMDEHAGR